MDWKEWNGKRVFLKLRDGAVYSGNVVDVDDSDRLIIFLTLIDKFGEKVTIVTSEIVKLKEENE